MRFLSALLFTWCVCCDVLLAENANVRSAEHVGFTRIAIDVSQPAEIRASKEKRLIVVRLPKSVTSISTNNFYERISRDRVGAIGSDVEKKQIVLSLTCDCIFREFLAGSKTFVIDVLTDANKRPAQQESAETPKWPVYERAQKVSLGFSDTQFQNSGHSHPNKSNTRVSVSLPKTVTARGSSKNNFAVERLHSALAQSVEHSEIGQIATGVELRQHVSDRQISFRSLSSGQIDGPKVDKDLATVGLIDCSKAKKLDPSTWERYENARDYLVQARLGLIGRHDEDSDAAARVLAKSYLSLAMGAEAKAILQNMSSQTEADLSLVQLADFTDGNARSLDADWFQSIEGCSEVLLWQVLSAENIASENPSFRNLTDEQLQIAREQFEQWPPALKGVFGPRLAAAFTSLDARDTATYSLRKSKGQPGLKSGEREIITAKINSENMQSGAIKEILNPVALSNADVAPNAAIELATLAVAEGENLGAPQKEALESFQAELKGTELEPELLLARTITAIHEENFESATLLIADYSTLVRASKTNIVLDKLGAAILQVDADALFLTEAVSLSVNNFNRIAEKTRLKIKARMKTLGFGELAAQLGKPNITRGSEKSARVEKPSESENRHRAAQANQQANGKDSASPNSVPVESAAAPSPTQLPKSEKPAGSAADLTKNVTPLSKAMQETQLVLDSVAALKKELLELGL